VGGGGDWGRGRKWQGVLAGGESGTRWDWGRLEKTAETGNNEK